MRNPEHRNTMLIAAALAAAVAGCGRAPNRPAPEVGERARGGEPAVYQAEVEEGIGAAIVVLVDSSGSMAEVAPGDPRPKNEVARAALAQMLDATTRFQQQRPDFRNRSGVYRKHLIVVTDGQNTSGADPGKVARDIHARSEGSVRFHFVAFDTNPERFGFLREVGGEVVAAGNGQELAAALKDIYEGRILAEADYGETGHYDPRQKQGAPR